MLEYLEKKKTLQLITPPVPQSMLIIIFLSLGYLQAMEKKIARFPKWYLNSNQS